uniref:Centromere protein O n=1 Tax=Kryptolebias marmoratus TaxID=37003 RepID=A0A3Q3AWM7_KRYMA
MIMKLLPSQSLQKLRSSEDRLGADEDEEGMEEDEESSQLLRLMARHLELTDVLRAHHLIGTDGCFWFHLWVLCILPGIDPVCSRSVQIIRSLSTSLFPLDLLAQPGGYDIVNTRQGKGVCVSLATAYEGVYLDTYNLEIDFKPKVRLGRHNIPPFIPLSVLSEQSDLQAGMRAFLDTLSQHLNAFVGRRQQLKLVKVPRCFDSGRYSGLILQLNVLCSVLVLMLSVPRTKPAVLCTLEYTDHTRCLPTRVHFDCEGIDPKPSPAAKRERAVFVLASVCAFYSKISHEPLDRFY